MMNGEGSDLGRAEKIAAAKRKLREFESRKVNGGGSSIGGNRDGSSLPSPTPSSNYYAEQPANGRQSTNSNASGAIYDEHSGSMTPLEVKVVECESLKKQLNELHGYYTQVHAAYNDLSQKVSSGTVSGTDTPQQIQQLQTALAMLVEEKTALQSRMRAETERADRAERMMDEIRRTPSSISPAEVARLKDNLAEAERMVHARAEELNRVRMESADLQTAGRASQQDRAEMQARLRALYKEKEQLEADVKEARKEVSMKDLHIRQLNAAHGQWTSPTPALQSEDDLTAERDRLLSELEALRKEASEAIQSHAAYERQLQERCSDLGKEMESLAREGALSRVRVQQLEDDLEAARAVSREATGDGERQQNGPSASSTLPAVGISEEEVMRRVDETAKRITVAFETRIEIEREEQRRMMEVKDAELAARLGESEELRLRLDIAERRVREDESHAGSFSSLLEELQNEKATVSRALSQNRELKEQVIELEDRLIALTNEKAAIELARQTAEHELGRAADRREGTESPRSTTTGTTSGAEHSASPETLETLSSSTPRVETEEKERQLRELHDALRVRDTELAEVREQLRRSQTQNDSMNAIMQQNGEDENQNSIVVELGQAIGRVSALTEENARLKEQLTSVEMGGGGGQGLQEADEQRMRILEDQLRYAQVEVEHGREWERRAREFEAAYERERQTDDGGGGGVDQEKMRVLEERLAMAEGEAARLLREGGERTTALEGRLVESEAKRALAEERTVEVESRMNEQLSSMQAHYVHALHEARQQASAQSLPGSPPPSSPGVPGVHAHGHPPPPSNGPHSPPPPASPSAFDLVARGRATSLSSEGEEDSREFDLTSYKAIAEELQRKLEHSERERAKMEHIQVALQQENETITDHVVLYQHYRKVMRERLRAKDEEMAVAEAERARVAGHCTHLQHALKALLAQQQQWAAPQRESMPLPEGVEVVLEEGEEAVEGGGGERVRGDDHHPPAVRRILEIMQEIQASPAARPGGMPKCTQCIGETIEM